MFESPTIAGLAERVEEAHGEHEISVRLSIVLFPGKVIYLSLLPKRGYGFWINLSRTVRSTTLRAGSGLRVVERRSA